MFYPGWREEDDENVRLRSQLAEVTAQRDRLKLAISEYLQGHYLSMIAGDYYTTCGLIDAQAGTATPTEEG
jgi:hypothetical protein